MAQAAEVIPISDPSGYAQAIARAVTTIRGGGVVVVPTETVYGSAGMLSNPAARQRLGAVRGGEAGRPFTVHLAGATDALPYLGDLTDFEKRVIRKLWPGPVGLRFDVKPDVRQAIAAKWAIAEADVYDTEGRITLRCPDHPVAADVLANVDGPVAITAPRAAQRANELAEIAEKVDLVLDDGPTRFSKPSTLVHVGPEKLEIVRAGVYDDRIIQRLMQTTVLFICSGNTCRSPMAEGIARKIIAGKLGVSEEQLESKGIQVASAGVMAMPGARATPQGVEAVRDMGVDLSKHRSRLLTIELIHQADAIFAMGRAHQAAVVALVPSARDKTKLLDPSGDIDDPIGADVAVYRKLAKELEGLIEKRLGDEGLIG